MAPADMASPPSSSTYCDTDHTESVAALVIVAVVAMFLLHVLGSLRGRSSNSLLHAILMGIYTLSYPLVSYTIGRMRTSDCYFNDFTVWAVFLVLLLSTTDSLTACRLNDIDNWKSIYVKQLLQGFLMVSTVVKFGQDMEENHNVNADYLWYPLSAILLVITLKSYVMIASMRMVSKSYLGKNAKVIADYMQYIDNKQVAFNPMTMEGCQYMVAGEKHCVNRPGRTPWYKKEDDLKVTTVQQIWQCEGNLLIGDWGKSLKDLCLSMALSKMLNRRFAGFKLSAAELEKTKDFVFKGLLTGNKQPHLRAFRVIEEELVFVHGMYYTRYSYLYQKGRYLALCLPVTMVALCSWLTVASLVVKRHDEPDPNDDGGRRLMSRTIVITVVLAFLEAYQLYLYMASGWSKVALIRSYVTTPFLQKSCSFLEIMIGLLLRLKSFRPWKCTLGQYCILQDVGHKSWVRNCLHYATLRLVDKANKSPKKSVKLSENVKKAIVDSLLGCKGNLTNGVASLQRNGVHADLSWACDATATDGAVTRTILVWHIATTLCHHKLDAEAKEEDTVRIASTLSQYCLHLLAFAPHLLPDHSSISESILDQSIDEAGELLEGAKDLASRCEKLMKISSQNNGRGDETQLVAQGAQLARNLIKGIEDPTMRWKVLSDFWAEMMLYVSPSDYARAHLEALAKGGEFITHLWCGDRLSSVSTCHKLMPFSE